MTSAATYSYSRPRMGWFRRSENWLDEKGKGAWIAAMVLGFVFFWPIGLALLFYMLWSKRMFAQTCGHRRQHSRRHGADFSFDIRTRHGTGNTAFDAYKEETLRRLEEEQEQFETFLQRLREAKDKAEFDQFMDDRARQAAADHSDDQDDDRGSDDDDTTELREPKRT